MDGDKGDKGPKGRIGKKGQIVSESFMQYGVNLM